MKLEDMEEEAKKVRIDPRLPRHYYPESWDEGEEYCDPCQLSYVPARDEMYKINRPALLPLQVPTAKVIVVEEDGKVIARSLGRPDRHLGAVELGG